MIKKKQIIFLIIMFLV